jgi:asparagine synthase (glutamine-hydrolysing)
MVAHLMNAYDDPLIWRQPVIKKPLARIVNLVPADSQCLLGMDLAEAEQCLLADDPGAVLGIAGSFALMARDGERVSMARSLDRPLRYFLAKEKSGPMLVVADRIDAIRQCLEAEGYGDQFHPSYTRMVPAHHVTTVRLVGCPDPNPVHRRFFTPERATATPDLDALGERYVGALLDEVGQWLRSVPEREPLGVLFSGGIDSGAVLLAMVHQMLAQGKNPARLKAFTLAVDGGGKDAEQAREFLRRTDLEVFGETIEATSAQLDPLRAVEVIEDYRPLDVECATVGLALLQGIRERYPDWRFVVDGDGGDENLKDYPIEENTELTIVSVVNNSMLYQEGWGVDAIKHSLTYSGGLSRGYVRTYAPARHLGFQGFSPFTCPGVIQVAESIPFDTLTDGDHGKLYALKGEVVRRGIRKHLGIDMPVFPKCRFQHGAVPEGLLVEHFGTHPEVYRQHYLALHTR